MKINQRFNRQTLRLWLLSITIGAGLIIFAGTAVQQSLRLGLNDPQWQIAANTAYQLSQGSKPSSVIPTNTVDESRSLAPFVTIVDSNIHVLASSGKIGNIVPLPPTSSFPDAQKRGNNWFTWQHDNNSVRDATVIVPYSHANTSGYVLVARSMKQVEHTIGHIMLLAALTLIGVLVVPTLIILLV